MENLDIATRLVLACEAEATGHSLDQALVLPTLKVVLGAIGGEIVDSQITDALEKIVDSNHIENERLDTFAEFYRTVVDTTIFYLDVAEVREGVSNEK